VSEGVCHNEGCSRSISKKWILCRPCAVADVAGRHAYLEPCAEYRRGPVWHLDMNCAECGFDSAAHPGKGRVMLTPVTVVWDRPRAPRSTPKEELFRW
jgi:hypothetical protein